MAKIKAKSPQKSAKRAARTLAEPAGGKVLARVCDTRALQIEEWYASNVRLCRPGRKFDTTSQLTAVLTDSLLINMGMIR